MGHTDFIVFSFTITMMLTMSLIARNVVSSAARPSFSAARTQIASFRRFHASTSSLKSYVSETEGPVDSFEFRVKNYAADGGKVRAGWARLDAEFAVGEASDGTRASDTRAACTRSEAMMSCTMDDSCVFIA